MNKIRLLSCPNHDPTPGASMCAQTQSTQSTSITSDADKSEINHDGFPSTNPNEQVAQWSHPNPSGETQDSRRVRRLDQADQLEHGIFAGKPTSIMDTEGKTSRPRWRISAEVASELAAARQKSIYPSWDDFYRALLRKWQEMPMPLSELRPMKDDPIAAKLEQLDVKLITLLTLAESQSQRGEADQVGQERMAEVIRRIHDLLALALNVSEPSKESSNTTQGTPMSERTRKALEYLRKRP